MALSHFSPAVLAVFLAVLFQPALARAQDPLATQEAPEKYKAFHPGAPLWADTTGEHIQAHGGGILEHDGVYYWYGEQRGRDVPAGVRVYSSTDLYNWQPQGVALQTEQKPGSDLRPGSIIERPKVVYNPETDQFVMWFHLELAGLGYWAARTGLAVSDSPTGPFTYLRSYRPHAGLLPVNAPIDDVRDRREWSELVEQAPDNWEAKVAAGQKFLEDLGVGQMARDMTVYVDNDGTAYHVHSSEENRTLHIAKLTDDYLNFSGEYARVLPGGRNEAPAVFKHDGTYYLIASGLTGWDPNRARSYVADSMFGPWESLGNPTVGGPNPYTNMGPEKTFGAQSTYVLPAPGHEGEGKFIAMFDVWQPEQGLETSRYIWLPLFMVDGKPVIRWYDEWDLSIFEHDQPPTQ